MIHCKHSQHGMCQECLGKLSELVNAAGNMLTGISIHNRLDKDAPARRDDIGGIVVSSLSRTYHEAARTFAK